MGVKHPVYQQGFNRKIINKENSERKEDLHDKDKANEHTCEMVPAEIIHAIHVVDRSSANNFVVLFTRKKLKL